MRRCRSSRLEVLSRSQPELYGKLSNYRLEINFSSLSLSAWGILMCMENEQPTSVETGSLLWLDLEMTGVDTERDLILEVAAIVTDWDFNEIAVFESGVGQNQARVQELLDANPWYTHEMPENKQAMLELNEKSEASELVEQRLIAFVKEHCNLLKPVALAGNSIHMDRRFIHNEWPTFEQLLHYRMLDVTAWKLVFEAKYGTNWQKPDAHRALEDIRGSIEELKYYLERVR